MENTTVFKSISIQTFSNHFHPILKVPILQGELPVNTKF